MGYKVPSCFDLGQMSDDRAHLQTTVNMGKKRTAA